jgi:phosphoenolpyruvate carboxykinase (GTP)
MEAYGKEPNIPGKLFEVLNEQWKDLKALRDKYGPIITPSQLEEF